MAEVSNALGCLKLILNFDQIGGILSSNMEQLNKKRDDLKKQQTSLNGKIATREEKQSYLVNRKNELEARQNELNRKSLLKITSLIKSDHFLLTEKIQKLLVIREEFDKFIETTEQSQGKIDESVATLLYVVKKESDTIIRKKLSIGAQMQQ